MILVISNLRPAFNAKIPSAQFIYRYFNLSILCILCFQWSRIFCGQISYEHSLGWSDFSKVFMQRKCLHMMSCHVLRSMSLEVFTGVYIVPMVMHPKALCWKKSFLEIEDQNLLSGARSVLTFGRRSYQILVWHFSTYWL